jgi:hypothetical protein
MGMRRSPLLQQCTPMPGGLIPRADHLGIRTGRRGARHIPEVRCKRPVPALRCALARLGCAARGLLEPAGRQLPRHPMERRHPIDLVLVIPRADGGAMPLHPARGPSRRHQGQAGCVLAPQHARPGRGCFFTRPVLLGRPAAPEGRPGERARSAGTAACWGADSRPASPCAARRSRACDRGTPPVPHRSRWHGPVHNAAGRLSPTPGASGPTPRAGGAVAPAPTASFRPPHRG